MYAYIILPYIKVKNTERNQKKEGFSIGSLMTSAKDLNFTGKDGVFNQISKGVSQLEDTNSKFSVLAMSQLLKDGKVDNMDALNYLCTGFSNQLGLTAVSMGYQTVDACVEAIKDGSINGSQFLSNIGNFTSILSKQNDIENINREQIIIIDTVLNETEGERQVETAERRVESGQTLNEFLHNMPETFNLSCGFFDGENYQWSDFKYYIDYLIDKKIEVSLQLGDNTYNHLVLTQFTPDRDGATPYRSYQLAFKRIAVGSVDTVIIENEYFNKAEEIATPVVENPVDEEIKEKTETKKTMLAKLEDSLKEATGIINKLENQGI